MKQSIIIFVCTILVGVAFWAGRLTKPDIPANNADGLLAYEHYYECADKVLQNVTITDTAIEKELALAKQELEDYIEGHIMTWPVICDQRDMLSDIIRKYANEENSDIINYVEEYFEDPSVLNGWAYSY